jgi:hypothetical protein
MKIITEFWRKPVPARNCDWSATDDDYDGAPDTHPPCPVGWGATEAEAIDDLREQMSDRRADDILRVERLTSWCRRHIEPPPADILYDATAAIGRLKQEARDGE